MNDYVYILSNLTGTTIYIGITNDLVRRMYEHRKQKSPLGRLVRNDTAVGERIATFLAVQA